MPENSNNASNSGTSNTGLAGLANIGVAVAFAAMIVSMEQTCAAFIAEAQRNPAPKVKSEDGENKKEEVVEEGATESDLSLLQGARSFALVCLFGIFFMTSTSTLVSKKRIFPMKGFTYLLAGLAVIAFGLQFYLMRKVKGVLSDGERTVRFTTSVVYMAFLGFNLFVMNMFG